jgi:hypothetical protein
MAKEMDVAVAITRVRDKEYDGDATWECKYWNNILTRKEIKGDAPPSMKKR